MSGKVVVTVGLDEIDTAGRMILDEEMEKLGLKRQGKSTEGHDVFYPEGTYVADSSPDSVSQLKEPYYSLLDVMKKHQLRGKYIVWTAKEVDFVCGDIRNA